MPGSSLFRTVAHGFRTIVPVVIDLIRLAVFTAHWRRALAAENLFLRKQLALFQERKVKPRRANDSARLRMVILSRMFRWRGSLVNVKADTLTRIARMISPTKCASSRTRSSNVTLADDCGAVSIRAGLQSRHAAVDDGRPCRR